MAIIEYRYRRRKKRPHQISFYTEAEWGSSYHQDLNVLDFNRDEIVLWLNENISRCKRNARNQGKRKRAWKEGFTSKAIKNCFGNPAVIYGYCFYFLRQEDAMLFKLAWG